MQNIMPNSSSLLSICCFC